MNKHFANSHDVEAVANSPSSLRITWIDDMCPTCGRKRPKAPEGRPKLNITPSTVCDALRSYAGERGAVARVAREFGVSRGWVYKHVVPLLRERM